MSPEAMIVHVDDKIALANKAAAELLGIESPKQLQGRSFLDFVHPDSHAVVNRRNRYIDKQGQGVPFIEEKYVRADGRAIPVEVAAIPFRYKGRSAIQCVVHDISKRKQDEEALRESERQLRILSARLLTVQEEERALIAKELHDGISQTLSAIKYGIEEALAAACEPAMQPLKDVIPLLQNAIGDVRRMYMGLRPSVLDDFGILATIDWFCRDFLSAHPGIEIERNVEVHESEIPDSLKPAIFRIVQQAMDNVIRHSQADYVVLSLRRNENRLELAVEDEGVGFDSEEMGAAGSRCAGIGLASMRDRVELSGGVFAISSVLGEGTTIEATWVLDH